MQTYRSTMHSVRKVIANHLTPLFAQEASSTLCRLLSWFTVVEDLTGFRVEDLKYYINNVLILINMH